MITIHVNKITGSSINVVTGPSEPQPSPYLTYGENRIITGLYSGSPNILETGTYTDYYDIDYVQEHNGEFPTKEYSGYVMGSPNKVLNDPYALGVADGAFDNTDYDQHDKPPSKGVGSVILPNATSIGRFAFQFNGCLGQVSIPKVTSIGQAAFNETAIASVSMDSVVNISLQAFCSCTQLTSLNMPNVVNIGNSAFFHCGGLTQITIGEHIQAIGMGAFETTGQPITMTIGKTVAYVEAMGTDNSSEDNIMYQYWNLPPGSSIICTDGTIPISDNS